MIPNSLRFGGLFAAIILWIICLLGLIPGPTVAQSQDAPAAFSITVDTDKTVPISDDLFGVNYVWNKISASDFPDFSIAMSDNLGASLIRYPGGWEAEWFDWSSNTTFGWNKSPLEVGAAPSLVLSSKLKPTFVIATRRGMEDLLQLDNTVANAVALVKQYAKRVKIFEIGNEWWRQAPARGDEQARGDALQRYATVVSTMIPELKKVAPSAVIYVNGDWTRPHEFEQLRRLVGETAWKLVDGVAIHPYCGDEAIDALCLRIDEQVAAIRSASGKPLIYASEWSAAQSLSGGKTGMPQANLVVVAFGEMAKGRVAAAAYWPPVRVLPGLALVNSNFGRVTAIGATFGLISKNYRGQALEVSGNIPAIAASSSAERMIVIVPSMSPGQRLVRLAFSGSKADRWIMDSHSITLLSSSGPQLRWPVMVSQISAQPQGDGPFSTVFTLNDQLLRPGSRWEIAVIRLSRKQSSLRE